MGFETPTADQDAQPMLLRILQFYTAIRLLINTFVVAVSMSVTNRFDPLTLTPAACTLVVLVVILWPRVRRWLGKKHLTIALMLATMEVQLIGSGFINWYFATHIVVHEQPDPPALLLWLQSLGVNTIAVAPPMPALVVLTGLFVLTIVVSWRFRLRTALLFVLVTSVFDIALALQLEWSPTRLFLEIAIVVTRTVMLMIIAAVIAYLVGVQNRQTKALSAANAALKRQVSVVEELSISQERNRLARELHDTLAHTLSAASVQLEATQSLWSIDPDKARLTLTHAMTVTRDGLSETRRALMAMRASPLDDLGLFLALKELCDLTRQRGLSGLKLTLPARRAQLPAQVEQTIYRTAQEALENALRHANARSVALELTVDDGRVRLSVHDDGVGFDVAAARAAPGRFGLNGLVERAALVGGHVTIDSAAGAGTRLLLDVNLDDDTRIAV
jgi:signal transduction histidine kinase